MLYVVYVNGKAQQLSDTILCPTRKDPTIFNTLEYALASAELTRSWAASKNLGWEIETYGYVIHKIITEIVKDCSY